MVICIPYIQYRNINNKAYYIINNKAYYACIKLIVSTVSLYAAYDCVWQIRRRWIRLRKIRLHYKCNNLDVLYDIAMVTSCVSSYCQRSYHAERWSQY